MSRNNEYEKRLRRIVLHSADVIPNEVSNYLLNKHNHFDAERDILINHRDYKPLVDYTPQQFVDFALDCLIKKPSVPIDYNSYFLGNSSEGWSNQLGINGEYTFLPAAPIQGPFLYLLNQNEDEGLRLVQSLINVAIERWRHRPQIAHPNRTDLIPVPVTLRLTSGLHDFWGNVDVYCWFRGRTTGPYPVQSALMALEVWMENQIEAGRDVEELFEKVLSGSDCVAVPGMCLGIALAYSEKCLKAALPIISHPMIWTMDISRYTSDLSGTFRFDPLERNKLIYDFLEERDKRPQRSREIRNLAVRYMLSADDDTKSLFQQATRDFTKNLPFFTRGDQDDPKMVAYLEEDVKRFQIYGDLKNYRQRRAGDYIEIIVEPPEEIRKRDESQLSCYSEWNNWLRVWVWVQQTLDKGEVAEGMTLEEVVVSAKKFQQPDDFTQEIEDDFHDYTRLQAVVGTAVAVLTIDFKWAQTQSLIMWCRDVFLAALRSSESSIHATSNSSVKLYAGRGLALLVAHDVADAEVQQQILQLIGVSLKRLAHSNEAVKAVFSDLKNAWDVAPVLCWNALSLCLSLSIIPGKLYCGTRVGKFGTSYEKLEAWEESVIQNHFDSLAKNEIPELPRIPTSRNIVFVHEQAKYGLYALPLTELCKDPTAKIKLLQLCDDLMARTITDNLPVEGRARSHSDRPHGWNPFIFNWAACLAISLSIEGVRHHIFAPLQEHWLQVPELVGDLLDGYICHQIAYSEGPKQDALEIWKEVCSWIINSSLIARVAYDKYLDNETEEVLQLIVFCRFGHCYIKEDWQYAYLFTGIFDKWVGVTGHNPYAYTHLLTMLNSIGWQFSPEPTLNWLNRCASNATHDLWNEKRGNGRRTAELLNRIWNSFEKQIRKNVESLQRYSDLVYRLVGAGVPLASVLQKKLEGRG